MDRFSLRHNVPPSGNSAMMADSDLPGRPLHEIERGDYVRYSDVERVRQELLELAESKDMMRAARAWESDYAAVCQGRAEAYKAAARLLGPDQATPDSGRGTDDD